MLKNIFIYIPLLFCSPMAIAECDTDTVQFYIDKGFNQDQITQLCSATQSSTPAYQPYQKPLVIYQEGTRQGKTAEESRAINVIQGGVAARSIEINDTTINYIRNVCFRAGNSPEVDQRAEKCIQIAYSIAREGLVVTNSGQAFGIFGDKSINIVTSDIKRKHVTADPWKQFPVNLRYQFQRKYERKESGNETSIPVLHSASVSELANALRVVSSATANKIADDDKSEVERIFDEDYIAPSEDEYAASQPKIPNAAKEKKGKWWNPFD